MTRPKKRRFTMVTSVGYREPREGHGAPPGVTVTIHDRAYCGVVVWIARSEDRQPVFTSHTNGGGTIGVEETIAQGKAALKKFWKDES